MEYQLTFTQGLFCTLAWLIAYVYEYQSISSSCFIRRKRSSNGFFLLALFLAVYSVFEYSGGDYYHYMEAYDNYKLYGVKSNFEDFYEWLADVLPYNFYLWRLCIWGPATLLWVLTIKHLRLDPRLSAFLLFSIFFWHLVGARQFLGFGLLYLGFSLFLFPFSNRFSRKYQILGLLLIAASYPMHKTMLVYILIMFISMLPINRIGIIVALLAFPLIWKGLDLFTGFFILQNESLNEQSAESMERYMDSDFRVELNAMGIIRLLLQRLPIWLLLIYSIRHAFFSTKRTTLRFVDLVFLRASFIMVYVSCLFLGKDVSAFISPRFWDASLTPFVFFLASFLYGKRRTRFFNLLFLLMFISTLYTYLYSLYKIS